MTTVSTYLVTPYGPVDVSVSEPTAARLVLFLDDVQVAEDLTGTGLLTWQHNTPITAGTYTYRGESYAADGTQIGVAAKQAKVLATGTPGIIARPIGRPEVDGWRVELYGLAGSTTYRLYRYNSKTRSPVYNYNPFTTPSTVASPWRAKGRRSRHPAGPAQRALIPGAAKRKL